LHRSAGEGEPRRMATPGAVLAARRVREVWTVSRFNGAEEEVVCRVSFHKLHK